MESGSIQEECNESNMPQTSQQAGDLKFILQKYWFIGQLTELSGHNGVLNQQLVIERIEGIDILFGILESKEWLSWLFQYR